MKSFLFFSTLEGLYTYVTCLLKLDYKVKNIYILCRKVWLAFAYTIIYYDFDNYLFHSPKKIVKLFKTLSKFVFLHKIFNIL